MGVDILVAAAPTLGQICWNLWASDRFAEAIALDGQGRTRR